MFGFLIDLLMLDDFPSRAVGLYWAVFVGCLAVLYFVVTPKNAWFLPVVDLLQAGIFFLILRPVSSLVVKQNLAPPSHAAMEEINPTAAKVACMTLLGDSWARIRSPLSSLRIAFALDVNEADVDGGSGERPTCQHGDEFSNLAHRFYAVVLPEPASPSQARTVQTTI